MSNLNDASHGWALKLYTYGPLCHAHSAFEIYADMQVNFLAVDESEYRVNFKILQKVASQGSINGLNKEAKVII